MSIDRREAVATLLGMLPDALVVTGLGSPTYDVHAAGARETTFHLWGAMGGSIPLGLGLALAQPSRSVVVVTGDGEQLMGIGSLATVSAAAPDNLTVVVLDNGHFGETGMQVSHTSLGTDLVAVARGFGLTRTYDVTGLEQLDEVAVAARERTGTTYARIAIESGEKPRALPPRDGVASKNAFRSALGFAPF